MTPLNAHEPQSAADYDERTTAAVKSVLIEIGQILGSFVGKFVIIGGIVPWLRLDNEEMPHVGSLDVDLDLHAEALGDGEYTTLVKALMAQGYEQRKELRRFQLARQVAPRDDGPPIDVIVDFLMPRDAIVVKNTPPLLEEFAVQRADGADLALKFHDYMTLSGFMPERGTNRIEIAVCTVPALIAMKGHALKRRQKQKDAYDIYYSIRNYPGGTDELAAACQPVLKHPSGDEGFRYINEKFETLEALGPSYVRGFVEDTDILGGRTPEQWQQDAFGQVDAFLRALGVRS